MSRFSLVVACAAGALLLVGCGEVEDLQTETNAAALRAGQAKVELCHLPPGSPDQAHTIAVGAPAVETHFAHGDFLGSCEAVDDPEDPPNSIEH